MTAAHYKGGHHPGNDLGLHYTALPPIVASCPYSDQLLVTRKFWSPGANRPSQVSPRYLDDAFENLLVAWLAFAFLPERPTRSQGGTDGSNPLSSSGESRRNFCSNPMWR